MNNPEPQPKPHILVVDDDTRLRDLLKTYLRDQGFAVTVAIDAADARAKMELFIFDLMVLDVMMPKETGIELAKSLPASAPPVLLLTAMAEAENRISGFEAGADDYLVKPFEPRELVLRINAILRRTAVLETKRAQVKFGEYMYDIHSGRLMKKDEACPLTTAENQLLRSLAENAGEPVTRAVLASALGNSANERNVDVHITRLRKKLETDNAKPFFIQTIRGAGYALQVDS